ncbi:oxaloacetate decarboxylase subunit gamma [Thaumasiovibrio subtropicus]|uniref:oxaloacetate decarboxylase subunit gamma n=1 Tax=Thaumasiovibrio subtropicus TaxID=1891207 RepID=UPI000B35E746|nr:oxaloacetate decarboxylase subunit gamma [Thaumasiovibrio subtropicus]
MSNISDLLVEAATLMLTGMVFVFVFLSILIFLVQTLASRLPKEVPEAPEIPSRATTSNTANGVSPSVVAAIAVAIKQHRQRNA